MNTIWVMIFIGVMIYRVINKLSETKKSSQDWQGERLPPVVREIIFPWEEETEQNWSPLQEEVKVTNAIEQGLSKDMIESSQDERDIVKMESCSKEEIRRHNASREFQSLFCPTGIINGLIMREVLGPPRCKQRR